MRRSIKIKTILILIFLLSLYIQKVFPQADLVKTGQSTMNFLLVGTSSRACALGEAYTALGTGVESMFYNPAGLTGIEKSFDININYTQWIADINYLSGAIAWNLGTYGVVGLNLLTIDYGTINGTSLIYTSDIERYPAGYIDNGPVGNVGAYAIGLSYAKAISEEFSIGVNFKLAGQNLGRNLLNGGLKDNDATKFVFDAGVKYNTGYKGFVFGMSLRNFSSNIKREEVEESLPLLFSFGAAINLMKFVSSDPESDLLFSLDFLHPNNYSERVNLGLEYKFLDMISLRGGYQTNRDLASWSGGIGFNTSISSYDLDVNYSYSKFKYFDSVNRVSLIFSF